MARAFPAALVWLLLSGLFSSVSSAQGKTEPRRPYPAGSDLTFEWTYSCPNGTRCSFSCPGAGGASHVTQLTIYLGKMRVGSDNAPLALFYEFSTVEIPRGNGFIIDNGLGRLACQVNGMMLSYSGPPRSAHRD
jgi:hypothetical protein